MSFFVICTFFLLAKGYKGDASTFLGVREKNFLRQKFAPRWKIPEYNSASIYIALLFNFISTHVCTDFCKHNWIKNDIHTSTLYGGPRCKNTGCSGKIVFFFQNPLQPIPSLHIEARDFRSYQSNASEQSLLLDDHCLYMQYQPSACEEEVAKC